MLDLINKFSTRSTRKIVFYYLTHPITLCVNRFIILSLKIKKILGKDINFTREVKSHIPIDVVICAIKKDYDVLTETISSIKKYIRHPIGNIYLICPPSRDITKICKDNSCIFVDEDSVLPITKETIDYKVRGVDRSAWLYQQLLKWGADKFVKNEHFLITDSDTVYIRPQIFIHHKKVLLPVSHKLCHLPYYDAFRRLTGISIKPILNFTCHHSLFEKEKLKELKTIIEKRSHQKWYEAIIKIIDKSEGSSVSDFETYGQYVYYTYRDHFELEYWYNYSLKRTQLINIKFQINRYKKDYKNISFHSYDT